MTSRRRWTCQSPRLHPSLRRGLSLAAVVAASAAAGAAAVAMFWPAFAAAGHAGGALPVPMPDGRTLTLSRRAVAVSPDGSQHRLRCRWADISPARRGGGGTANSRRRSGDSPGVLSGRAIAGVLGGPAPETDLDCRRCASDDLCGRARAVRDRLGRQRDPVLEAGDGTDARVTRRRRARSHRATDRARTVLPRACNCCRTATPSCSAWRVLGDRMVFERLAEGGCLRPVDSYGRA